MSTQTQYVVNRQDPAIEAYRLGLLGDVQSSSKVRLNAAMHRLTIRLQG